MKEVIKGKNKLTEASLGRKFKTRVKELDEEAVGFESTHVLQLGQGRALTVLLKS